MIRRPPISPLFPYTTLSRSMLRATGIEPNGPADLDEWRERHPGLHPHVVLLAGLRARYDELELEWLPYLSRWLGGDRKSTRLNSSHLVISYAVFCLKKKNAV